LVARRLARDSLWKTFRKKWPDNVKHQMPEIDLDTPTSVMQDKKDMSWLVRWKPITTGNYRYSVVIHVDRIGKTTTREARLSYLSKRPSSSEGGSPRE
jgi:hypothetical protein